MTKEKRDEGCIFCKIAGKRIKTEIIEETDNFVCFPDAHPIARGHCLIIPKKHFVTILDLPSNLGTELISLIKRVGDKLIREGADGFNLAMNNGSAAGQAVFHAHMHVIPRKNNEKIEFGSNKDLSYLPHEK